MRVSKNLWENACSVQNNPNTVLAPRALQTVAVPERLSPLSSPLITFLPPLQVPNRIVGLYRVHVWNMTSLLKSSGFRAIMTLHSKMIFARFWKTAARYVLRDDGCVYQPPSHLFVTQKVSHHNTVLGYPHF